MYLFVLKQVAISFVQKQQDEKTFQKDKPGWQNCYEAGSATESGWILQITIFSWSEEFVKIT